jgi:16S rRNA (guanine527-N7)-methyltransferase
LTCQRELIDLLTRYGVSPASVAGDRFLKYLSLLEKWGRRFNLVGSLSWENLGPLFEEGLWAGEKYPKTVMAHLDIGSGAGFPALPIRIVNPAMLLRMVESRTKRAVFLETACHTLGLDGVLVNNSTLRAFLQKEAAHASWDCVSWKALRLRRGDFAALVKGAKMGASFWVFHGEELPVEGGRLEPAVRFCSRDAAPMKPGWHLSVYRKSE